MVENSALLMRRFSMIFLSETVKVLAISLFLLSLPFRIFRKRSNSTTPVPPPSAKIITHQQSSSYSQPRDTLVFIHGFPDSSSLWDSSVPPLTAAGYRCVTVDLPGAKGEPIPHLIEHSETAELVVDALQPVSDKSFTLVGHDWGSLYASLLRKAHPNLVHRMVLLDVGEMTSASGNHWTGWLSILSYQSAFALMYFIGEPCAILQRTIMKIWKYRGRPLEEVTVDMTYHYPAMLMTLAKTALGQRPQQLAQTPATRATPVPYLFIYGRQKPFQFHDSTFLEKVRASPHGEVVPLPCEHWIMLDLEKEWVQILTQWLEKSEVDISAQPAAT